MHYYLLPENSSLPEPGSIVVLDKSESKHLLRVLRASIDDEVFLVDGCGSRITGMLKDADLSGAVIEIIAVEKDELEHRYPKIHLACGIIKNKRFEWALEKSIELGVSCISPLLTDNCEIAPRQGKQQRWQTLLQTATKQSGRSLIPTMEQPVSLAQFLDDNVEANLYYGLARSRFEPAGNEVISPDEIGGKVADKNHSLVWLVGPEGGWSDKELKLLAKHAVAVRLGPHRLRTETAVVAGLSFLQSVAEKLNTL
jgi:16S rRNA (uracil1498-N3)-methyltransferase